MSSLDRCHGNSIPEGHVILFHLGYQYVLRRHHYLGYLVLLVVQALPVWGGDCVTGCVNVVRCVRLDLVCQFHPLCLDLHRHPIDHVITSHTHQQHLQFGQVLLGHHHDHPCLVHPTTHGDTHQLTCMHMQTQTYRRSRWSSDTILARFTYWTLQKSFT